MTALPAFVNRYRLLRMGACMIACHSARFKRASSGRVAGSGGSSRTSWRWRLPGLSSALGRASVDGEGGQLVDRPACARRVQETEGAAEVSSRSANESWALDAIAGSVAYPGHNRQSRQRAYTRLHVECHTDPGSPAACRSD